MRIFSIPGVVVLDCFIQFVLKGSRFLCCGLSKKISSPCAAGNVNGIGLIESLFHDSLIINDATSKLCIKLGRPFLSFSWPTAICPWLRPRLPFLGSSSQEVCHVFFYSFNQNSTYIVFENPFQLKADHTYTSQLQCESIDCFLYDTNWKLFLNRLKYINVIIFEEIMKNERYFLKWKTELETKSCC